jgi:hypothetical protein
MVVNTVQGVGPDTDLVILRYADFSLSSYSHSVVLHFLFQTN